jgi:hypothetical protein
MEKLFITEANGILLFRTASIIKEKVNEFYDAELKLHRYDRLRLVEYTLNKPLRTTDAQEAKEEDIKQDKFKK